MKLMDAINLVRKDFREGGREGLDNLWSVAKLFGQIDAVPECVCAEMEEMCHGDANDELPDEEFAVARQHELWSLDGFVTKQYHWSCPYHGLMFGPRLETAQEGGRYELSPEGDEPT